MIYKKQPLKKQYPDMFNLLEYLPETGLIQANHLNRIHNKKAIIFMSKNRPVKNSNYLDLLGELWETEP